MSHWKKVGLLLGAMLVLLGCPKTYQENMTEVARNWCRTISASLVVPVYPLEEEIRPGDIYLVSTPHVDQIKLYKEKGFLPMNLPLHRIQGLENEYNKFYAADFFPGFASNETAPSSSEPEVLPFSLGSCEGKKGYDRLLCLIDKQSSLKSSKPARLPMAVFPSYTVEVGMDGSFGAGISLKGIPLGLSLLQSSRATAVVSIKDAYSVGLPFDVLYPKLQLWAWSPDAMKIRADFAAAHQQTLYVRLVTKVFLAQQFDVVLLRESSFGGNVLLGHENGKEQAANATQPSAEEQLTALITQNLVGVVASQMPKGEVALTGSSSMGVSLREKLGRAVVLGYHAVDVPILKDGILGFPIATSSYLLEEVEAPDAREESLNLLRDYGSVDAKIGGLRPACAKRFMQSIAQEGGEEYKYVREGLKLYDDQGVLYPDNPVEKVKEVQQQVMHSEDGEMPFWRFRNYFRKRLGSEMDNAALKRNEQGMVELWELHTRVQDALSGIGEGCQEESSQRK